MFQYEPRVSVVIPAYNAANYLAAAIESALAQTYPNVEILVINDGSKDDGATAAVASKYAGKIRYFEKENGGSSSALNMGIRNMEGEWFSWLSHDDLYEPDKLEKQIRLLNQLPETERKRNVLFCGSECIDANGKRLAKADPVQMRKRYEDIENMSGNEYLVAEPTRFHFNGCGCLIHRSVFECVGMFDERLRLLNDVDLWYRIYINGYRIRFLPEVLVYWRIHGKQVSQSAGFSYHNPEQDRYWMNALQWLIDNCPENPELFFRFGRNAYLKTRDAEGDRAFEHLRKLAPGRRFALLLRKNGYKIYARTRYLVKQIVLKFRT